MKLIAAFLVVTMLSEDIARAGDFSRPAPANNLQVQNYVRPPANPALGLQNRIEWSLTSIILSKVRNIGGFEGRIIDHDFDHEFTPNTSIVFNFRKNSKNPESGKRREGQNWVIPFAIADTKEVMKTRVYWAYEAVVNDENHIVCIRRRGEKRAVLVDTQPKAATEPVPVPTAAADVDKDETVSPGAAAPVETAVSASEEQTVTDKDNESVIKRFFTKLRLYFNIGNIRSALKHWRLESDIKFLGQTFREVAGSYKTDFAESLKDVKRLKLLIDLKKLGMDERSLGLMYARLYHRRLLVSTSPEVLLERARNLKARNMPIIPKLLIYDKDVMTMNVHIYRRYGPVSKITKVYPNEDEALRAAIERNFGVIMAAKGLKKQVDKVVSKESVSLFLFRLSEGYAKAEDMFGTALEKMLNTDRDTVKALIAKERNEFDRGRLPLVAARLYAQSNSEEERSGYLRYLTAVSRDIRRVLHVSEFRKNFHYNEIARAILADPDGYVMKMLKIEPGRDGLISRQDKKAVADCIYALRLAFPLINIYTRARFEPAETFRARALERISDILNDMASHIRIPGMYGMPAYAKVAVSVLFLLLVLPAIAAAVTVGGQAGAEHFDASGHSMQSEIPSFVSEDIAASVADLALDMPQGQAFEMKEHVESLDMAYFGNDGKRAQYRGAEEMFESGDQLGAFMRSLPVINNEIDGALFNHLFRNKCIRLANRCLDNLRTRVGEESYAGLERALNHAIAKDAGSLAREMVALQGIKVGPDTAAIIKAEFAATRADIKAGVPAQVEIQPDVKPGSHMTWDPETDSMIVTASPAPTDSDIREVMNEEFSASGPDTPASMPAAAEYVPVYSGSEGFMKSAALVEKAAATPSRIFSRNRTRNCNAAADSIKQLERSGTASTDEVRALNMAMNTLRRGLGNVEGVRAILGTINTAQEKAPLVATPDADPTADTNVHTVTLSDVFDGALKNARRITRAAYQLERAGLRVDRAEAGRVFWDIKLIYESNDDVSGSAAIDTQAQGARDDAAQVSIDRQNLADAEAALANDEAQLAQEQASLERNTAQLAESQANLERNQGQLEREQNDLVNDRIPALENDQQQLAEAIAEGNEGRIQQEQAEIEEDLLQIENTRDRITQENTSIANNQANISQETDSIENNNADIARENTQIAYDRNEVRLRQARLAADEEKLRLRLKKMEELRKPELRLRSDVGVELLNPDRSRDVGAEKAGEAQSKIALEQEKLEACGSVDRLSADIVGLERNVQTLSKYVLQLESLYEKAMAINDSSYDITVIDLKLAAAKRDLVEEGRRLADMKSELRHLQRWPEGMRFNMDGNAYQPKDIDRILRGKGIALDRYYSLLLANKAEEVEYFHAQVPSALLRGIGVKVEAVWREDILRRFMICTLDEEIASQELAADQAALELDIQQREIAMQNGDTARVALKDTEIAAGREAIRRDQEKIKNSRDYLRDPTFIGLRGNMTFGDPKRSKASRQALLAYLKSVDEYIALEKTAETARDNARRASQAAEASYEEAISITREADASVRDLETGYDAGLGTLAGIAAGMEEAKNARIDEERAAKSRREAGIELIRARYSTQMDLETFRPDDLAKMLDVMKDYRKYFRRGNTEKADKAWLKVAEYMPDLMRPESLRQVESYIEKIKAAINNTVELSAQEKAVSDKFTSYITERISAEDRRALAGLVMQFEKGRRTIGNILRGTVKSRASMSVIMDKIKAILPLLNSPEDVDLAALSLGAAPYNVRTPSFEELVQTAIDRKALAPAAKDVEMARNASRDDVNLFLPVLSVNGTFGVSTDILDMQSADFSGSSLRNSSGVSVSAAIPVTDPGKRERLGSGGEFVTAALIREVMAERDLRTQAARQLVAIHSNIVEHVSLGDRAANIEERIRILKSRPDSSGPQIDSLDRARRVIIMRQSDAVLEIEKAKNGLKDVLKLGPADVMAIENITDMDIDSALERLRESLKGNFVLESAAGAIPAGSMITVGADNRITCNGRGTSLSVFGTRNIKNVAVRDNEGKQVGQFVIDAVTGTVLRSDIRSISTGSLVLMHDDATISVTRSGGKSEKIEGAHAGDIFDHRVLSLVDASGRPAGMVRIDPGTGDDALIFGEHRARRRAYALSSAAIKKDGDAVSFVFTVYPLSAGGIRASASPILPDSWIDKVPVVRTIFGARSRQAARAVSSSIATEESRRQDILLQSAENIAAKQREAAIRMYRLARQKSDTARHGFESCGAWVKKLEADSTKLPDPGVLLRARSDMSALARLAEQTDNELAELEILLASLDIGEQELDKDAVPSGSIDIDEALSGIGQRVTDELSRIDIAIADELKGLASLASMFDGEIAPGIGAYRSRNEDAAGWKTLENVVSSVAAAGSSVAPDGEDSAVFAGTANFRFRPRLYTRALADLNVQDARILANISIETARKTSIELYREYAMAAVREASAASKASALAGLVDIADGAAQAGLKSDGELVAARTELGRAQAARLDAGRALVSALTELAKLVETKTGVAVDPRSFLPIPASMQDIGSIGEQFRRADRSRDNGIRDIRNRREQARLEERQAWWTILPTLGADLKWSGAASGIDQTYEASMRILGSGRSIRAKLARIKAGNLEDSERDRVSELQYRWELIEHELSAAAEEAKTLEGAIRAIDVRIGVLLEDMSAQYAMTTIDTSQEMRRLITDYENLKARCVEARIRSNIARALAAEMLKNLGVAVEGGVEGGADNVTLYDPYGRAITATSGQPAHTHIEREQEAPAPPVAPAAEEPAPRTAVPVHAVSVPKKALPAEMPAEPKAVLDTGSSKTAPAQPAAEEIAPQPAQPRRPEVATPEKKGGFFARLKRDAEKMLADFRGEEDTSGAPIICEVEPLWSGSAGDARATLISYAEDGSIVAEGDTVAEFDPTFQIQQRDEQQSVVGKAKAALDEAEAVLRYALELKGIYDSGYYSKARRIAESGITAGSSMSDLAAQNVARAEANIEILQRQLERVEAVLNGRVSSPNDLARAEMLKNDGDMEAVFAATGTAGAARIVREGESGTNLVNAVEMSKNVELTGLVERAVTAVEAARGILRSQEERLGQLERNVANCVVRAPRAGKIKHDRVVGAYPVEPVPREMKMGYGLTVGYSNALPMRIVGALPGDVNEEHVERSGVAPVKSRARTAGDSRLGATGLTVEDMVPDGWYVEKGQPMTWYGTSVAKDNRSEDEAILKEHAALEANYAAIAEAAEARMKNYVNNIYPAIYGATNAAVVEAEAIVAASEAGLAAATDTARLRRIAFEAARDIPADKRPAEAKLEEFERFANMAESDRGRAAASLERARLTLGSAKVNRDVLIEADKRARVAAFEFEIATARANQRMEEKMIAAINTRIRLWDEQIANSIDYAPASGRIVRRHRTAAVLGGFGFNPDTDEDVIGPGHVMGFGENYAEIHAVSNEERDRLLEAQRAEEERRKNSTDSIVKCEVEPIRRGPNDRRVSIEYIVPNHSVVTNGELSIRYNMDFYERERAVEQNLFLEWERNVVVLQADLDEALVLEASIKAGRAEARKAVIAKKEAAEEAVKASGEIMTAVERIAASAARDLARMENDPLRTPSERRAARIRKNDAENTRSQVLAEAAASRRQLDAAQNEIKLFDATTEDNLKFQADIIARTTGSLGAAREILKSHRTRLAFLDEQLKRREVYADRDGEVIHENVEDVRPFWIPIRPAEPVKVGAELATRHNQTVLRITDPKPGRESAKSTASPGDVTVISHARVPDQGPMGAAGLTIEELPVPDKSRVKSGQVIAKLNSSVLESYKAREEAAFARQEEIRANAAARIDEIAERSAYRDTEYRSRVEREGARVERAKAVYEARIAIADSARRTVAVLEKSSERASSMAGRGSAMQAQFDLSFAEPLDLARIEASRADEEAALARAALEEAKACRAQVDTDNNDRLTREKRDRIAAEARKRTAEEKMAVIGQRIDWYGEQISNCVIRATADGVLKYRTELPFTGIGGEWLRVTRPQLIRVGSMVRAEQPMFYIHADLTTPEASASPHPDTTPEAPAHGAGTVYKCEVEPLRIGGQRDVPATLDYVIPNGTIITDTNNVLLFSIDPSPYEESLAVENALYYNAQATATVARVTLDDAAALQAVAVKRHEEERKVPLEKIGAGRIMLALTGENKRRTEAGLALAQKAADEYARMAGEGIVSERDLGAALAARDEAALADERSARQLASAMMTLRTGEKELEIVDLNFAEERATLAYNMKRAQNALSAAQSALKAHLDRLETLRRNITNCRRYADRPGRVVYANEPGAWFGSVPVDPVIRSVLIGVEVMVSRGQPILSVVDISPASAENSGTIDTSVTVAGAAPVVCNVRTADFETGATIQWIAEDGTDCVEGETIVAVTGDAVLKEKLRSWEVKLEYDRRALVEAESKLKEEEARRDILRDREEPARAGQLDAAVVEAEALHKAGRAVAVEEQENAAIRGRMLEDIKASRAKGAATDPEVAQAELSYTRALDRASRAGRLVEEARVSLAEVRLARARHGFDSEARLGASTMQIEIARAAKDAVERKVVEDRSRISFFREQIERCRIKATATGKFFRRHAVPITTLGFTWRPVPVERAVGPGAVVRAGGTFGEIRREPAKGVQASPTKPVSSVGSPSPIGRTAAFLILATLIVSVIRKALSITHVAEAEEPRQQRMSFIMPKIKESFGKLWSMIRSRLPAIIVLLAVVSLTACSQSIHGRPSLGAAQAEGAVLTWYATVLQNFPSLYVIQWFGVAILVSALVSYLFVLGISNKREAAGRLMAYGRRPFLYVSLAAGVAAATWLFPGFPSAGAWSQGLEAARIVITGAVLITYPLKIAGIFIYSFFHKTFQMRVRAFFPRGEVKIRWSTQQMSQSDGMLRSIKSWVFFAAIAGALKLVAMVFSASRMPASPNLTFSGTWEWAAGLFQEIAKDHSFVNAVPWIIAALCLAVVLEVVVKKQAFVRILRDDDRSWKRALSKLVMLTASVLVLSTVAHFMPASMIPDMASWTDFGGAMERILMFLFVGGIYLTVHTYFMSLFSPRMNVVTQAPQLLTFVLARFRSNLPRLIVLQRMFIFTASVISAWFGLAHFLNEPFLNEALSWYWPFSQRVPGIIVLSSIALTVYAAIAYEMVLKKFIDKIRGGDPHLRRSMRRWMIPASFILGVATSFAIAGTPSFVAWSSFTGWMGILATGFVALALPVTIIGAFFLTISARVVFMRWIVPFVPSIKLRIREFETSASGALWKLLNIWKWVIAAGFSIYYAAPLIFTPERLPLGHEYGQIMSYLYSKAIAWAGTFADKLQFTSVVFYVGAIIILATILELVIKKITAKTAPKSIFEGDEYFINRMARKIPAVGIAWGLVALAAPVLAPFKASVLVVSAIAVVILSALELALLIWQKLIRQKPVKLTILRKPVKVTEVFKGASIFFIGLAVLTLAPANIDAVSMVQFWKAVEIGSAGLAAIGLYFSAWIYLFGTQRINRVLQAPFVFPYLVVRMRQDMPRLTALIQGAGFTVTMLAISYLAAEPSSWTLWTAGILSAIFIAASAKRWYVLKARMKDEGIGLVRREEKFDLENVNGEPRDARDMMEAMGMTGDRFNPTRSFYYNHSLYLDTPGYQWKGFGYFRAHPGTEIKEMLTRFPALLTYYAREIGYRDYRYKARIRWYGDRELISFIEQAQAIDASGLIASLRESAQEGTELRKRLESTISRLTKEVPAYRDTAELREELLELAGQTAEDKGKVHLEIKNRLDTRMWKFETGVWEWAVPYILALADGGTVRIGGNKYVFRLGSETGHFFRSGPKKGIPVFFSVSGTGEKRYFKIVKRDGGYSVLIDGAWQDFTEADIDKRIDYDWLPDMYQGKPCRNHKESRNGLKEFCEYVRDYGLIPTVQVSYERLEYVSVDGDEKKLIERLVPLARDYKARRLTQGPDAEHWRMIYASPAGKYLRAILTSSDPEHPNIKIDPEDLGYLRMTLDMNVRCRGCDDFHNPTLFTGVDGFMRIWPGKTVLEVKYRGQRGAPWVYDMIDELNELRADRPANSLPIRRKPDGKACDGTSTWLYSLKLSGEFATNSLGQLILRAIGIGRSYPASPRSVEWTAYTRPHFDEERVIDQANPYDSRHGIEPMGYGNIMSGPRSSTSEEPVVPAGPTSTNGDGGMSADGTDKPVTSTVPAQPDPRLEPRGDGMDVPQEWEDRANAIVAGMISRNMESAPAAQGPAGAEDSQSGASYNDGPPEEWKAPARDAVRYRLLDATDDKGFADAFADAIDSFYREKKKVILAFDSRLGGGYARKARAIFDIIDELGLIGKVEVIDFNPLGELKALKDKIADDRLVFTFTRNTEDVRLAMQDIENSGRIKQTYIDEAQISGLFGIENVYYPLFEIVTIALSKDRDRLSIEEIREIAGKVNMQADGTDSLLIFTILPPTEKIKTEQDLVRKYANKKELLRNA